MKFIRQGRSGRRFAAAAVIAAAALVATGCSATIGGSAASSGSSATIKIGYVTPRTGPLAAFGEADNYVLAQMTAYYKTHEVATADGLVVPPDMPFQQRPQVTFGHDLDVIPGARCRRALANVTFGKIH